MNIYDNFSIELQIQLNKDFINPLVPYSLEFPQYKVNIIIGENLQSLNNIQLYQPQIIRILKTLELVGFFNEYKDGILAKLLTQTLSDKEVKEYHNIYLDWKNLSVNKNPTKGDLETIEYKRSELVEYEKKVYYPKIIDIRKLAIKQF